MWQPPTAEPWRSLGQRTRLILTAPETPRSPMMRPRPWRGVDRSECGGDGECRMELAASTISLQQVLTAPIMRPPASRNFGDATDRSRQHRDYQ